MSYTLQPGGINRDAQNCARIHGTIASDGVPIGSVEWTQEVAESRGVTLPDWETYPPPLQAWLGRRVERRVYAAASKMHFVKPVRLKAFTGAIRSEITERVDPLEPCWIADPVKFVAEWRIYVLEGAIATWAQYGEGDDAEPDLAAVAQMLAAWPGPAGWALDVGRLADGRQVLVEANDGWALGFYKGADSVAYLEVIAARWAELAPTAPP
jgi:hypothetical protein